MVFVDLWRWMMLIYVCSLHLPLPFYFYTHTVAPLPFYLTHTPRFGYLPVWFITFVPHLHVCPLPAPHTFSGLRRVRFTDGRAVERGLRSVYYLCWVALRFGLDRMSDVYRSLVVIARILISRLPCCPVGCHLPFTHTFSV